MSVKTKETLAVDSPDSRGRNREKELAIDSMESGFFDAMLTFGWLAERQSGDIDTAKHKIIDVNDSLREWLWAKGMAALVDEIKGGGVGIREFLEKILHDEHRHVGSIVEGNLRSITQAVEKLKYDEVVLHRKANDRSDEILEDIAEQSYTVQRTLRFVSDKGDKKKPLGVLAGVRVVAPGAIRLRSDNERDRVDFVSVCQSVRQGDGWTVVHYQGLLQQAWLRVKATIRAGTQAGTVGLVSRNMSHNIGSHALFYLEMDEIEKDKRIFFRYMRERMELLAGFATSMPLSSAPGQLSELIEGFEKNQSLLTRIARSERVEKIRVEFDKKNDDREIALPGGVLSAQALYSIFENNIRDSAKHGRTKHSSGQSDLTLRIQARDPQDPSFREDFIELVVSDNRYNYDTAGPRLRESLARLRIVDETGRLEPGDWGVKERFISAALLRGRRLEDIDIQLQVDPGTQQIKYFIGDYAPDGEPRILDVTSVEGNLAWVFYLLKPKEVLLIGSNFKEKEIEALDQTFGDAINVNDFDWLRANIAFPSKVRHRFLVVCVKNQAEVDELEALRDKLPYRVIICLPHKVEMAETSRFASISEEDLDLSDLSLGMLYQLWVNWLLDYPPRTLLQKTSRFMRKLMGRAKNSGMPDILFFDAGFKALTLNEREGSFHWILDDNKDYQTDRPILLFDRHGSCMQKEVSKPEKETANLGWSERGKRFAATITHYEPYLAGDALSNFARAALDQIKRESPKPLNPAALGFSFLEAGLTKILIVDERIDPTSRDDMSWSPNQDWKCSRKELFKWKGVDIRGEEYARDQIPGPELLMEWVKEKNYDFLVLHKGIVDKLIKLENKDYEIDPKVLMSDLFASLRGHVRHIVIHSGRMASTELPDGVKFMSLSNVDIWLKDNRPKIQIVEDLYLLRRP